MTNLTTYEYDIFLSYNRADEDWTGRLAERLEKDEWQGRKLKVFFAPWDIRPGQSIPLEIEKALPKSRKVAIVLSPEAMASAWVELERMVITHIAITAREERLIPLLRRTCEVPALLHPLLNIDFRDDSQFEEGYLKLLAVVRDEPLPRVSRTPAVAATTLPASIPRPTTVGFVTRHDAEGRDILEQLKEKLAPQKRRLVALWGTGGVGKTTLAVEAIRALEKEFANRIVWTGPLLRADFSFSTLLDEIATQLGRADLRTLAPEMKEEQVRALIAAPPPLIVLDNFETITPEEQARCTDWLAHRASCPALITTRERINHAANIQIAAMSPDEARTFVGRLVEGQDPRVFTSVVCEQIIQAAEATPLVMEWIVGQIELADAPRAVLEDLERGEGEAAERVFGRSFNLPQLGDDGRAALLVLSLFVPNASLPALAAATGFGEDVNRLRKAVRHLGALKLVRASGGETYRLLLDGLTRRLAKARLTKEGRADEFRQRYVAYFLRSVEAHAQPTPEDYDVLEAEKDNLLNAADAAFADADWGSVIRMAYALANPVAGVLSVRGYWDEALRLGELALKAARSSQTEGQVAGLSHNLAVMYQYRGELAEARRLYDESLEITKKLGDQSGIASTLHELAILAQDQGEHDEARRLYGESLEIAKKLGNQRGIAITLHNLAAIAQEQGEHDEARRLYGESLEIKKKLGNQSGIAITLHQLATLSLDEQDLETAERLLYESLALLTKIGNRLNLAECLESIGKLKIAQRRYTEAQALLNEALEIATAIEIPLRVGSVKHTLGLLTERQGDETGAAQFFRDALSIFESLGSAKVEMARQSLAKAEGGTREYARMDASSLKQTMDEMSEKARGRGLTPEMLDSILEAE